MMWRMRLPLEWTRASLKRYGTSLLWSLRLPAMLLLLPGLPPQEVELRALHLCRTRTG